MMRLELRVSIPSHRGPFFNFLGGHRKSGLSKNVSIPSHRGPFFNAPTTQYDLSVAVVSIPSHRGPFFNEVLDVRVKESA